MYRAIVTVQRFGDPTVRELEVPAGVPVTRLAEMISQALGWDQAPSGDRVVFQIEAQPLGRRLSQDETLASVGAWDGSWLILHPVGIAQRPPPRIAPLPIQQPRAWEPAPAPPPPIPIRPSPPPVPAPAAPPMPPRPRPAPAPAPVPLNPRLDWHDDPTPPHLPVSLTNADRPPPLQPEETPVPFQSVPDPADGNPLRGFRPWRSRARGDSMIPAPGQAGPARPDPDRADPAP